MIKLLPLLLLLASCATDPLQRHRDEFPPKVPKAAPDGNYPTRRGWITKDVGIAYLFEF